MAPVALNPGSVGQPRDQDNRASCGLYDSGRGLSAFSAYLTTSARSRGKYAPPGFPSISRCASPTACSVTRAGISKRTISSALLLIISVGFFLRLRAANHPYISQWDEAYHALVAKNLTAHPLEPTLYEETVLPADDREWTKARVWLHKPTLPLWLMSAGIAVFGENELSFRLPAVVFDTLVILLIFLLGDELFDAARHRAGLFAAAFYAINPLMIRLVSGRIPNDTTNAVTVFFVALTVFLFVVSARRNSRLACRGGRSCIGSRDFVACRRSLCSVWRLLFLSCCPCEALAGRSPPCRCVRRVRSGGLAMAAVLLESLA